MNDTNDFWRWRVILLPVGEARLDLLPGSICSLAIPAEQTAAFKMWHFWGNHEPCTE